TGNYDTQWLVSFAQSGIGTDTTATVVSVNSSDKTAANLAAGVSVCVTDAGSVTYDFKSPVAAGTVKRYTLNNVSGSLSASATHRSSALTGNYDTQWLVSFAQSGIGTDTTATVVSVNSSDKTAANLA